MDMQHAPTACYPTPRFAGRVIVTQPYDRLTVPIKTDLVTDWHPGEDNVVKMMKKTIGDKVFIMSVSVHFKMDKTPLVLQSETKLRAFFGNRAMLTEEDLHMSDGSYGSYFRFMYAPLSDTLRIGEVFAALANVEGWPNDYYHVTANLNRQDRCKIDPDMSTTAFIEFMTRMQANKIVEGVRAMSDDTFDVIVLDVERPCEEGHFCSKSAISCHVKCHEARSVTERSAKRSCIQASQVEDGSSGMDPMTFLVDW